MMKEISHTPLSNNMKFIDMGLMMMGSLHPRSNETTRRRFCSVFGIEAYLCELLWYELVESGWTRKAGRTAFRKHLLWTLHFLRSYATEEVNACHFHCDEKTFRKWVWFYSEGISRLDAKFVSDNIYYNHN